MTDTPPAVRRGTKTAAGEGQAYWFFGGRTVIRSPEGARPVIIEMELGPGGHAPLHIHHNIDDSFYLVSGRLAMRCGDESFLVEPGGYVTLPHGVPHTFRVVGGEPAVMLQVHTDVSFLRFIKAVGRPATSRDLADAPPVADLEAAFQAAAETGQPVIGPPMTDTEAAEILAAAGG